METAYSKKEITSAADEYIAAKKEEALETMRSDIKKVLDNAMKMAKEFGMYDAYREETLKIPGFFRDGKGEGYVPQEIIDWLDSLGYGFTLTMNNTYRLY